MGDKENYINFIFIIWASLEKIYEYKQLENFQIL